MKSNNKNIRERLSEFERYQTCWCLNCDYSGPHGVKREIYPWFLTWRTPLLVFALPYLFMRFALQREGLLYGDKETYFLFIAIGGLVWALAAYGAVVIIRWIVAWKSYELICPNCGNESTTRNKPFNYLD